jgi:UDP-2,3-diacylglucosamine pyrophosphatase LpxH
MNERAVKKGLDRAISGFFTYRTALDVNAHEPWVIFSDQHKGAGDGADEFRLCKHTYLDALRHYNGAGYKLVLLGDVEELWENSLAEVLAAHRDVMEAEAAFGPTRYVRVWGNHDDRWMEELYVALELRKYAPGTGLRRAYEGVRLSVRDGDAKIGTLFMTHGHQGTLGSDRYKFFSRWALQVYRILQNRFGVGWFGGIDLPSQDEALRGEHDLIMYNWASSQEKMMLVAGHTHRPVWAGRTKEQQHEPGSLPAYFNTGCCKFIDGDITGIEIADGYLRLIKWEAVTGAPAMRRVLQEAPLRDLFAQLRSSAAPAHVATATA